MIIGNPRVFTYNQYPVEETLKLMVKLGYEGIELCLPDIASCKTDELRKQFADYVTSLGLKLVRYNVAAAEYFVPLRTKDDSKGIIKGLKEDIDITSSLGVNQFLTWEGRKPESATKKDVHGWIFDETLKIFKEIVGYGKKKDISISVEVHPFTLGIDLDFLVKLCDNLDEKYFGVTYDCCHFGVGLPDGYIDAILKLGKRIKHIHFSDSDKKSSEVHFPPGKGCLDMPGIAKALKEIKFNGTMMLDIWLYPLLEEGSRIGIPYLRKVMKTLGFKEGDGFDETHESSCFRGNR